MGRALASVRPGGRREPLLALVGKRLGPSISAALGALPLLESLACVLVCVPGGERVSERALRRSDLMLQRP